MISRILQLLFFAFIAIVTLGLAIVLFSIGIVALWYLLIILLIIWAVRRLYYLIKGEKPPTIVEQYYYYSSRDAQQPHPKGEKKRGRVIDYDDFKDK
jgi:hypothetical protein